MSKTKFNPTKACMRQGDKKPVRIIATDLKGKYPIVAAIENDNGENQVFTYTADGHFCATSDGSDVRNLVNVPPWPRRIQRTVWLNVYEGFTWLFSSKENADLFERSCLTPRLALVKHDIDVPVGHGLL